MKREGFVLLYWRLLIANIDRGSLQSYKDRLTLWKTDRDMKRKGR